MKKSTFCELVYLLSFLYYRPNESPNKPSWQKNETVLVFDPILYISPIALRPFHKIEDYADLGPSPVDKNQFSTLKEKHINNTHVVKAWQ